jgi:glutamine amidotransferase PdxT
MKPLKFKSTHNETEQKCVYKCKADNLRDDGQGQILPPGESTTMYYMYSEFKALQNLLCGDGYIRHFESINQVS